MTFKNYYKYTLYFLQLFITLYFTTLSHGSERSEEADVYDCIIEPRATIELGSPEEGILVDILVSRGDRVTKGLPLARLDSEMEKITAELARIRAENQAELESRRAQLAYRTKEVKRLQSMQATQSASEKDYDQAEIERRLAKLSLESALVEQRQAKVEHRRAKTLLRRREIRSPADGIIVDVPMSSGEYVHEQSRLMSIAEIDPLYVEVFLPVSMYELIKKGMVAEIKPVEPVGGVYKAKVAVLDSVFDAASQTFGVRLELPNADFMLPAGLRCTLSFIQNEGMATIENE